MRLSVEKFRKKAEKQKSGGKRGRVRYSEGMKLFAVEHAKKRMAGGVSVTAAARELGVSDMTLKRWTKESGGFREVEIDSDGEKSGGMALVTPRGYRLEGLDMESAAFLVRALG